MGLPGLPRANMARPCRSMASSSYVDVGNGSSLRGTGSMTWSAWVYATANPADDGNIIAKSNWGSGLIGWQFKSTPDTGITHSAS